MNRILVAAAFALSLLVGGTLYSKANDLPSVQGEFDVSGMTGQQYRHKINTSYGGVISKFIAEFEELRDAGARIELRGTCVSACTLMLGIFKREDICAGPLARWAFHSASLNGEFNYEGSRFIFGMYPDDIQAKLRAKGWDGDEDKPHPELVYFKGTDLVRACD